MQRLKFYGYSDDTFGEYGVSNIDYDNCANGKPITFEIKANNQSIYVTGQYNMFNNGCWSIGIAAADEDNLPDWTMRLSFEGYSTVLEVDVPDDFTIQYVERENT